MRVLYYALPAFLDAGLPFMAEMSRLAELHVLLEVRSGAGGTSMFDVPSQKLPGGLSPAEPLLRAFPAAVQANWRDVASFDLVGYGAGTSMSPASWPVARRAARHIRALAPDLIHLEGPTGGFVWTLAGLGRLPLVVTVHDPGPHRGENPWHKAWTRRLTFARAQRFILHNRAQLPLFCDRYGLRPERVDVIPLGVYSSYQEWAVGAAPAEGRAILFFGRLSPYKGLEDLFAAAPLACREIRGLHFIVAGRPVPGYTPPAPPSLPNGGRLEIVQRYIGNRDLAELFRRAAVVVCPYREATQSGVVLTAYAFGKPVVATGVGGLPEYVEDDETGFLVAPRSPEALAAALVAALRRLSDPEEAQRMGANIARRRDTDLAWEGIARRTLSTYQQALDGGRC